jgi:CheY-like chemotaxis protein
LVEDDFSIREAMREVLEGEGYEVVLAENGREVLDHHLTLRSPDLIILDLLMPVMDGWEFLAAREKNPALAKIPGFAITADRRAKTHMVRVQASLSKPFSVALLLETIEQVLRDA